MNCVNCKKDTKNIKFCSRSCSNSYNNRVHPKRKLTNKCSRCSKLIRSHRKICDECNVVAKSAPKFCKKHGTVRHSHDGRSLRCNLCGTERVLKYRQERRRKLLQIFGKKCQICSYSKTPILQFHHVNPAEKKFAVSCGNTRAWEKVFAEAKKCILVCPNCHQEIHQGWVDGNSYRLFN